MKKKQEDIIKTHVLNLDEIREAETKDKNKINKKRVIIIATMGIVFIVTGIIYPIIMNKFMKKESPKKVEKIKDSIICTSNFENKVLNIKISVEKVYNLKNKRLSSSTNKTTFSSKNNDATSINALYQKYNQLYSENKTPGAIYTISYKEKKLTITEIIADYNKIDLKKYDSTLNTDSKTLLFSSKYNYEKIKKQNEQLGSLCN